jgi:RimJ/RimL family protein N-acetyltransferase
MSRKNSQIREASVSDALKLRDLRLEALKTHPEAFGADYESDVKHPLSHWKKTLKPNPNGTVFIAEADSKLIGTSAISRFNFAKMSHNAVIWGVYVSLEFRQEKIGEKLIKACLDWAKQKNLVSVKLSVVATNAAAIRLYLKCGFQVYGVDPKVIKVGDVFYDELLMVHYL